VSLESFQSSVIRFLVSPVIANGAGSVYSWVNPEHPGFVYPEAMGLYLRLMSGLAADRNDAALARRASEVAEGLQSLAPPSGGVGMAGRLYLFDTCMAVAGLLAYKERLGGRVDTAVLGRMAAFIEDLTRRRLPCVAEDGSSLDLPRHWSTVYGAHMLKTVIALDALARETGEERYRRLALEAASEVVEGCFREGAFRFGPGETTVYTHAHCYALEGLLYLRARGLEDATPILEAGAESLRRWQNEDGSLFNWQEDPSRQRAKVGDATSQAVRVWVAVDREAYADPVERALGFLTTLRSPDSGIYYAAGSRDVNSITSTFAAQALEWTLRGARPEWLV
jgi:hypothetical protein